MKRRSSKAEYLVVAAVLGAATAAGADQAAEAAAGEPADELIDESAIHIAFLEYLGRWEDTDEDWMLFADEEDSTVADGDERAPDDDESAEKGDET